MSYLTVQEVAALARREHKTIRRAIKAGRLRAFRPGGAGRWLIREDDARAWIEAPAPVVPIGASGRLPRRTSTDRVAATLAELERKAAAR